MTLASFLAAAGDRYGDFVATKVVPIGELGCVLREIEHIPSGAQVMHIENNDPENLFCLSFKTYPTSSNGAPHILEHVVLCGSEKFPVKDPFFAMTRRSLNTYMNALTGSDFTCYPAASQVEKDFYNLLEVYIDAIFHPNLRRESFLQEGWRLEFAAPGDPKTSLQYKGIVYNEMKGSLASADSRLWHALIETLCPDLPYAYNSGGDPKDIPSLTYENLCAFHHTYYHPSRCLFFFYGNLPLKRHLDFLMGRVLKNVIKAPPLPPLPQQKRWKRPKTKKLLYPAQEENSKALIAFGWLTALITNQEEALALNLLESILLETDASPLKRALLSSGLCTQVEAHSDREMSEIPLAIICKGCLPKNAKQLEKILNTTLKQLIEEGIPRHLVDAALHQLEFSRTEIGADHLPFGLSLFFRAALGKQHGCIPEHTLMIHALFNRLSSDLHTPHYVTSLIEKHLLNNPHRLCLTLLADPHLLAKEEKREKKHLEAIASRLSKEQVDGLLSQAEQLAAYQKENEHPNLACLPQVTLADVPVLAHQLPLKQVSMDSLELFHYDCFTNQILYADLLFDLPYVAEEDLPLVHLFNSLITEVGCGSRSFAQNLEYIQAYTGGISALCSLHVQIDHPNQMRPAIGIRGKALQRHAPQLLALLRETVEAARFDEKERIKELVLQLATALENHLSQSAMKYAASLSLSGFSIPLHISEAWHGLRFFQWIQKLAKDIDSRLPGLLEQLQQLKSILLCTSTPHLVLGCDATLYKQMEKESFYGLRDISLQGATPWDGAYDIRSIASQARLITLPVAFTVQAFKTISFLHPHAPALDIAAELCDNVVLHRKVRETGGAYGTGAQYRPQYGYFYFHSYRDPHIARTLEAFQEAMQTIGDGRFTERELEEAKLGVIQHLDAPIAPEARASQAYARWREGKSSERLQHYRDRLLAATSSEVQQIIFQELVEKKNFNTIVCCASKELLEREILHPPLPMIPI